MPGKQANGIVKYKAESKCILTMKAGLWKGNKKKILFILRLQISHRFHYIIKNNSCPQIESIVFLLFEFPSISSHIRHQEGFNHKGELCR